MLYTYMLEGDSQPSGIYFNCVLVTQGWATILVTAPLEIICGRPSQSRNP